MPRVESARRLFVATRRVNLLTRLYLDAVDASASLQTHANESICVCSQGTDGIPGAEVQLAFDYRSSSGATATRSDQPGVTTTPPLPLRLIYPRGCLKKKKKETRKIERKNPLFLPSVRFSKRTDQRLAPFSLFRSEFPFFREFRSRFCFFFFFLFFRISEFSDECCCAALITVRFAFIAI